MLKICNLALKTQKPQARSLQFSALNRDRIVSKLFGNDRQQSTTTTFDSIIDNRRSQAKRTLLVQLNQLDDSIYSQNGGTGSISNENLTKFFTQFNDFLYRELNLQILTINHFQNSHIRKNYALIEFSKKEEVKYVMEKLTGDFKTTLVPIRTRMICFSAKLLKNRRVSGGSRGNNVDICLNQDLAMMEHSVANLKQELAKCKSLNEQILYICRYNAMNDFSYRLKFFLASYFEDILKQTFPSAICLPFGSTLNGFGTLSSDLDIVIDLNSIFSKSRNNHQNPVFNFQTKVSQKTTNMRNQITLTNLDLIAHILRNYLPDFKKIDYIFRARVPIIKGEYTALYPGMPFDISNSDLYSYLMTRLLWSYSVINPTIVQPMVRLVKLWTKLTGLSYPVLRGPPVNLTSFQATLLTLIFLTHEQLVPDIRDIVKDYDNLVIEPSRKRTYNAANNTNSTIINDFHEFSAVDTMTPDMDAAARIAETIDFNNLDLLMGCRLKNKGKQLDELFLKFLNFYANYDYNKKLSLAVTTTAGSAIDQLGRHFESEIYVCNPFVPNVNALYNIPKRELQRFLLACNQTIEVIEKSNKRGNIVELFEMINVPKQADFSVTSASSRANNNLEDESIMDDIINQNNKLF